MPDRRDFDAVSAARFRVEIEGVTTADFFSVGPLEATTAVIETTRGSDGIVRKTPGRHRYGDVAMRRAWSGDAALWDWRKQVLDGRTPRRSGSVIILDGAGAEIGRWNFFEGWPSGWRLGPWEGAADAPLIEEIAIAVEKIERA